LRLKKPSIRYPLEEGFYRHQEVLYHFLSRTTEIQN
jgi:hypothetical protein